MLDSSSESDEEEKEEEMPLPRPLIKEKKKLLTKQLSMRETRMELKWEKKKKQMHLRSRSGKMQEDKGGHGRVRSLTDEDLDELRGSIDLGFGFKEENGGLHLCKTLPALNLYFAVNRQFSDPKMLSSSPGSTPTAMSSASTLYGTPSPRSPFGKGNQGQGGDGWKIFNPGDSPQHMKIKLRHWAQAVACSVKQWC